GAGMRLRMTTRYVPSLDLSMSPRAFLFPGLHRGIFAGNMNLQCIHTCFPELPVMFKPLRCFTQRPCFQPAKMLAPTNFPAYESGTLQDHQVLRHCVQRNREGPGEIADGCGLFRQGLQDCPTCRI